MSTPASRRPVLEAWKQSAQKRQAKRQRELLRRGREPGATLGDGAIVEVAGSAEVNHTESDGSRTKTDHRSALARVESGYYSRERGERMAVVRTEDNKIRAIPEHRLKPLRGSAPEASRSSAKVGYSRAYAEGWERVFGKKQKRQA